AAPARQQLVDQPVGQLLAQLVGQLLDRHAALAQPSARERLLDDVVAQLAPARAGRGRVAGVELRSPSGLAALNVGASLAVLDSDPAGIPRGHDAPVRPCLHRSSDTPGLRGWPAVPRSAVVGALTGPREAARPRSSARAARP